MVYLVEVVKQWTIYYSIVTLKYPRKSRDTSTNRNQNETLNEAAKTSSFEECVGFPSLLSKKDSLSDLLFVPLSSLSLFVLLGHNINLKTQLIFWRDSRRLLKYLGFSEIRSTFSECRVIVTQISFRETDYLLLLFET